MKLVWFGIFVMLFLYQSLWTAPLKTQVSAKSAVLMNAKTGAILYQKKANESKYPASTTKLATMLYALEQKKDGLDEIVTCPYHCLKRINFSVKKAHNFRDPAYWLEPDGTHYWIKRGEKLSLQDLLYGMMLVSGNDASNFVAHHVGGTIPKFIRGLNEYLKKIGCKNTVFLNPHGLHHPQHITTAYDMALIMREVLKNSTALKIASAKEYERSETNMQNARLIQNTNQLLQPGKFFYAKALATKNGYHMNAGYTFAGAAKKEDRVLIAVLMDCEDSNQRYRDAIRLFEAAFEEEEEIRLLFNKEENSFIREVKKGKTPLRASLLEDIFIHYYPSEEPNIRIELNWEMLELPIKTGAWVGEIRVLDDNGHVLEKAPLYANREVKKKSMIAFFDGLKTGSLDFTPLSHVLIIFLVLAIGGSLYFVMRIRN